MKSVQHKTPLGEPQVQRRLEHKKNQNLVKKKTSKHLIIKKILQDKKTNMMNFINDVFLDLFLKSFVLSFTALSIVSLIPVDRFLNEGIKIEDYPEQIPLLLLSSTILSVLYTFAVLLQKRKR